MWYGHQYDAWNLANPKNAIHAVPFRLTAGFGCRLVGAAVPSPDDPAILARMATLADRRVIVIVGIWVDSIIVIS